MALVFPSLSWIAFALLMALGLIILIFIKRSIMFLLPPAIVAVGVHYFTNDLTLACASFIIILLMMIIARR